MKTQFFTVGPTQLYPSVPKHLTFGVKNRIGEISHRSKEAGDIILHTSESLKKLLHIPSTYHIFYLGSSLEAMERIIQNLVEKESFHVNFGEFSKKFASFSEQLGKKSVTQSFELGGKVDILSLKVPATSELICLTQNETSTGMMIDPNEISLLKKKYPKKLIAVDVVSSTPYVKLPYKDCDAVFFSVQKGFGMPAGLGVLIVSPDALEKAKKLQTKQSIGTYHTFPSLAEKEPIGQTPETPNLLYIYTLGRVTEDLLTKGMTNIRLETEEKANMLYDFFDNHKKFKPFVTDKKTRSLTSIVIDVAGESEKLRKYLTSKGVIVSPGYGDFKSTHIRIANFPPQSVTVTRKLLHVLKSYK